MGIADLVQETPAETAARCRTIIAELRDVHAREGSLPPVIRRAEELGVEIEVDHADSGPPSVFVREGDRNFGPLTEPAFLRDSACDPQRFLR